MIEGFVIPILAMIAAGMAIYLEGEDSILVLILVGACAPFTIVYFGFRALRRKRLRGHWIMEE